MSQNDSFDSDDIYDFDYLKDTSWDLPRPKAKPKVPQDNRIRLPPVLVGRNIVAEEKAKMAAIAQRHAQSASRVPDDNEKDWHKERLKLKAPRQPQKEVTNTRKKTSVGRSEDVENAFFSPKLPKIAAITPVQEPVRMVESGTSKHTSGSTTYRVASGGHALFPDPRPVHERNGATVNKMEDEFGWNLYTEKSDAFRMQSLMSSHKAESSFLPRGCTSVFDHDYLTPEEKAAAARFDIEKEFAAVKTGGGNLKEELVLPKIPQPPSAPKQAENLGNPRRRRVRYKEEFDGDKQDEVASKSVTPSKSETPSRLVPRMVRFSENTELNQDVSVHNESRPYYRPRPNTPFVSDYEHQVREAVLLNQRLTKANQMLHQATTSTSAVDENAYLAALEDILKSPRGSEMAARPSTAALANRNDVIATPASPYQPIQPQLRPEPTRTWNGEVARRGLGFKSKVQNNVEEKKVVSITQLPEKIRRQMKKYFN